MRVIGHSFTPRSKGALIRQHRIFVPTLQAGPQTISGNEAHHLLNVLRVRQGDVIVGFDGRGLEAKGHVLTTEPKRMTLNFDTPTPSTTEARWHITLAVALLKGDKMADIVRQGTELGVVRFIPVVSKHCDVPSLKDNKLMRWRRIAQEAAKQCGRSVIPEVSELVPLAQLPPQTLSLVAHPYASHTLQTATSSHDPQAPLAVLCLSGPEGGLAEEEVRDVVARGFCAVTLGQRILRAETTPIALSAALLIPGAL